MDDTRYNNGEYLLHNQTWHVEDSPWKAQQVTRMLSKHNLQPERIAEVGCGAGEVLAQVAASFPKAECAGYDLSTQAIAIAKTRTSPRISYYCDDITKTGQRFDVLLVLDVVEHVEDCFGFIRSMNGIATFKVYHIPLDFYALSVLRGWPVMQSRKTVGHIHYFFKDTALALLQECGENIIDYTFTASALEGAGASKSVQAKIMNVIRNILFKFSPDFTVRLLGGYSLLVLTR